MRLGIIIWLGCLTAISAAAYPLNGFEPTGIARLEGYFYALKTPSGIRNFVPGQLLAMSEVNLRLTQNNFALPYPDPQFSRELRSLLGANASQYSIGVLDVSNPRAPVYGGYNDKNAFIPGSTGKVLVALAIFQELANIYPTSVQHRQRVLRYSVITADDFAVPDTHEVPLWHADTRMIDSRPVVPGDQGNLWTYLDWMLSASSNAAGSMVMRELVLLRHFGRAYPPRDPEAKRFLAVTPKDKLARLLRTTLLEALSGNGLDSDQLFHGGLFTAGGKSRIPSSGSTANTRELVRFLLLMEQGKLVDPFSSLELKRLLYLTQSRIRYASAPELDSAAIYLKSGSLYRCKPEPNSSCRQYYGNALNLMNSAAIVEYPEENPLYHYLVALSSNVLKTNSAEEHALIAARLQQLIAQRH